MITIGLIGFSLYSQYRAAQREHMFERLANKLEQQKNMKQMNIEKYANILKLNYICKKIKTHLGRPNNSNNLRPPLLSQESSPYINKRSSCSKESPDNASTASFLSRSSNTLQQFVTPPSSSPSLFRRRNHVASTAERQSSYSPNNAAKLA